MTSSTGRIAARKSVELSRTSPPTDLSPVEWQRGLRRQFGREQSFLLENLGADPFFSEFRITNPASKSSYRVVIRGLGPGAEAVMMRSIASASMRRCPRNDARPTLKTRRHAGRGRRW